MVSLTLGNNKRTRGITHWLVTVLDGSVDSISPFEDRQEDTKIKKRSRLIGPEIGEILSRGNRERKTVGRRQPQFQTVVDRTSKDIWPSLNRLARLFTSGENGTDQDKR